MTEVQMSFSGADKGEKDFVQILKVRYNKATDKINKCTK